VVQGFDAPVPADDVGQVGGAGLAGGEAGDRVHGDGGPFLAAVGPDPAGDPDRLRGVREPQPGDGDDLEPADLTWVWRTRDNMADSADTAKLRRDG
jgi:hypothetical protein